MSNKNECNDSNTTSPRRSPRLVSANANTPEGSNSASLVDCANSNISQVSDQEISSAGMENEDFNSPLTRGAVSSNKRSKRPTKPSSASISLAQAKLNAKKRNQGASSNSPVILFKDHLQPARDSKEIQRHSTGVVYDIRMTEHKSLWDPKHPECPERFTSVLERCQDLGLLQRCKSIPPRPATKSELLTLHTEEHIEKLRRICVDDREDMVKLEEWASKYDSVYFHPSTYELSLSSCGSTIDIIQNILEEKIQNGMAIIRPPGHHAMKAEYCGYCFFNNVALAAKQALDKNQAQRILIVDFDVHHGQATQQMFYNDPRVLYFSTHRYEHGMFWPNLEESNYNWIGDGYGEGYNCNIPLNKIGMGNEEFLAIWHQILLPLAYKFNPDLVIVSAGYDAALGCPEGHMRVTPQCYPHLIAPLMGLANGKIAVILEGGYCLKSLAEGVALTLRTLLGDPCPIIPSVSNLTPEIVDTILSSTTMLREFLSLKVLKLAEEGKIFESNEVHAPVLQYDYREPKPIAYPTKDCHPIQTIEEIESLDCELNRLIMLTNLKKASHKVGLVYDDIMLKHRNAAEPGHPETPERISNIFACHADFGLLQRCYRVGARKATEEELRLIHTEEHILKMRNTQKFGSKDLTNLQERYNSVYLHNNTNESALYAAGSLLQLLDAVVNNECQSGVAIIRPPGHHAEVDEACGFCIYNNVSLAAQYALEIHGLKRILILDWDIHHGNGIQRMFEDDPRVLYISIHRYEHGAFFPCSRDANYSKVGKGKGEGFNVNVPWNGGGMGDTEYLAAFINVVLPIAYEFCPELVLVSAGFDAAKGDPLGGCRVTPEGYAHMTNLLMPLANGKIILALEGGYNLTAIGYSMTLCTKALLGDPLPRLTLNDQIIESAVESISSTLNAHAKYWTLIKPFLKVIPTPSPIRKGKYISQDNEHIKLNELMEKLGLDSPRSVNKDWPDLESSIPEPPPACGEPSPTTLRIQLLSNSPRSNIPNTSGSGENVAISPMTENTMEGAVGGVSNTQAIAEAARLMFNQRPDQHDKPIFLVAPLSWCPHLESITPVPGGKLDTDEVCQECFSSDENWICLTCYTVHCSRYVREHMVQHCLETEHKVALSCVDLSVWCYACDSYLDCEAVHEAKLAAHRNKFGEDIPIPSSYSRSSS